MSERVLNSVELKQAWQAFQASLVAAAAAQERINQAAKDGDPNLRAMIVAAADAAHTQWPQYAGKWDGPEWEVVRVRSQVVSSFWADGSPTPSATRSTRN